MKNLVLLFLLLPSFFTMAQSNNKKTQETEVSFEYTKLNPATDNSYPADFISNYNTGIRIYNAAIGKIEESEENDDPTKGLQFQHEADKLFDESKPFLEKAHELNKEHQSTITALTGVYFAIDDLEKYNEFKEKLGKAGGNNPAK